LLKIGSLLGGLEVIMMIKDHCVPINSFCFVDLVKARTGVIG
jgi:hypothetical protein